MNSFFRVSERNHLGMILMTELAKVFGTENYVRLPDIADRMKLPLGYLEEIALALKTGGLIEGRRGRNGGYRLNKDPKMITMDQILTALEGPIELVPCQTAEPNCPVMSTCLSQSLWKNVKQVLVTTLHQTTLADIV